MQTRVKIKPLSIKKVMTSLLAIQRFLGHR